MTPRLRLLRSLDRGRRQLIDRTGDHMTGAGEIWVAVDEWSRLFLVHTPGDPQGLIRDPGRGGLRG